MVITEPPEPSARLLSLGSKLYPSNMRRMLNKDLIRFKQSLSRVRQNRTSKRKVLLAGLVYMKCMHRGSEVFTVRKNAISKVLLFYRVFSRDVTAAIQVSQNNETAAMLVSQTNPLGVELFSYANAFCCSNKFAYILAM